MRVSEWSTVRVKHCAYSVPSRLIGEWVRVRIFEDKLEVRFADEIQLACERLRGRNLHRIDYRHVILSLVRKPGGFARYVYREEMFPSLVFRETYASEPPKASREWQEESPRRCSSSNRTRSGERRRPLPLGAAGTGVRGPELAQHPTADASRSRYRSRRCHFRDRS